MSNKINLGIKALKIDVLINMDDKKGQQWLFNSFSKIIHLICYEFRSVLLYNLQRRVWMQAGKKENSTMSKEGCIDCQNMAIIYIIFWQMRLVFSEFNITRNTTAIPANTDRQACCSSLILWLSDVLWCLSCIVSVWMCILYCVVRVLYVLPLAVCCERVVSCIGAVSGVWPL